MIDATDKLALVSSLAQGSGEFADIYCENTRKRILVFEDGALQNLAHGLECGTGIRLIRAGQSRYGYTNAQDLKTWHSLAQDIATLSISSADKNIVLKRQVAKNNIPIIIDPFECPAAEQAVILEQAAARARSTDARIRQVRCRISLIHQHIEIVNSLGEWVITERTYSLFSILVTAATAGLVFTAHESLGSHAGQEIFLASRLEACVDAATRRALNLLIAKPAPTGKSCVVLAGQAGGTLIHEAVGHGLEADLACDDQSVFSGLIGQRVAAPFVTITDGALRPGHLGTYDFDDEGTPAQNTVLIENGILKNFLFDRLSAMKFGGTSTGNGRRESYEYRPIVRMTNTVLEAGTVPPADILKSVDKGIYITKMGGGQVNTVNGDFVFEAEESYLIENGCITQPIRGATLIGNALEVLRSVDQLGTDVGYSIGFCGKDGQSVPISDGLPTLRIPEITIGGTG